MTQVLSYWDALLVFNKALDKVETGFLLHKLKKCRIGEKIDFWLQLLFFTQVQGWTQNSSPEQKHHLLLMIPEYRRASTPMRSEVCSNLQSDLKHIYRWADNVNMHFNADKFEHIRLWPSS